jgi:hypothetical protein
MRAFRTLTGLLCLLALAACGGGGGGGGGGNNTSISLSPTSVTINGTQGAVPPAAVTVHVNFVGDGVVVGYAPGVQQPSWLGVSTLGNTNTTADFALTVTTNLAPGTYTTSLRFVTGREDGTALRSVDLPVSYTVVEAFSVTSPTLSFDSVQGASAVQPAAGYTLSIRGTNARWRVTGVLPVWLSVSQTSGTGASNLVVTANSTSLGFGTVVAQLNIVDDTSGASRSLPVTVTHRAARLVAQPTGVEFSIGSSSAASAMTQTLALSDELGGLQPGNAATWSVQSISAPWLGVSPSSGTSAPAGQVSVHLDAHELSNLTAGDRSATITLVYQNAQAADNTLTIPVTLHDRVARVEYAAPYIGLADTAGTVILRGTDFDTAGSQVVVNIGGTLVNDVTFVNDTQVNVNYPARPAGHYPVSIHSPTGIVRTVAQLVVHEPPAFTYQAIDAPGRRTRIVYDAERLALYAVDRTREQLEQYEYAMGTWSASSSSAISNLMDIGLTPNGRELITLTRDFVGEIDLNASAPAPAWRIPNPDPFCGGHFDSLAMPNNGKALIVFKLSGCSGFTPSYRYDVRSYTLTPPQNFDGWLYSGTVGAGADGSRMYAGSNGVSPQQAIEIYSSETDTGANGPVAYSVTAISVSGNASRVIFQNEHVHDRDLALTGHLATLGVALASHDSSKAFVYRDDGDDPRIDVYDLDGALLPGDMYPVVQTIDLPDAPNAASNEHWAVTMAASPDDKTLFVSGTARILVVPVH